MKKALALVLCLVLLASLTVVSAVAEAPVAIDFWTPFTGGDGDTMQGMVDAFNASQSEVVVTHSPMSAEDMYEKIPLGVQTGSDIPDVCIAHLNHIPKMVDDGVLYDVTVLTENGVDVTNYPQWIVDGNTIDGLLYGIPLDINGVICYVNLDLLAKYGLESIIDDRYLTFDEIKDAYAKVSATGDDVKVCSYYRPYYAYLRLYEELGGKLTNEQGALALDNAVFTQMLTDLRALNELGATIGVDDSDKSLFLNGQLLFYAGGTWTKSTIDEAKINYAEIMPMCYSPETGLATFASHQFAMPADENRTEAEEIAVAKFVKWMGENSITWAEKAGQVPVHASVRGSDAFNALPQAWIADEAFASHLQLIDYYYCSLLENAVARVGLDPLYDLTIDLSTVGTSIQAEIDDAIAQLK